MYKNSLIDWLIDESGQLCCRFRVTSPTGDADHRLVYVDISAPPTSPPTTVSTSGSSRADPEVLPTEYVERQSDKASRRYMRRRLKKQRRRQRRLRRLERRGRLSTPKTDDEEPASTKWTDDCVETVVLPGFWTGEDMRAVAVLAFKIYWHVPREGLWRCLQWSPCGRIQEFLKGGQLRGS